MKILLIIPAGQQYRITSKNNAIPKRSMLRFSVLPVTMVAGAIPEEHDVEICDENVESLDFDEDVDLVGVSIMTATVNCGREIARIFRQKGKTVVAGGYHATLCPEDILNDFHAVVVGDAENTWPVLLKDVQKGSLKKIYKVDKQFNKAGHYHQRIAAIHKSGIGIIAGIIVGMDHDTVNVFENTLKFLQRTAVNAIQLNIMTPLPGTPLHKEYNASGRILDHQYDHMIFGTV